MAKTLEKRKAISLRKQGKSYSQIKKILGVAKGTLSEWLRNYPLSEKQLRALRDWNETRIENFRRTMRAKREKRLRKCYEQEKKKWIPLSKKELFLAGLFLYWGEGSKGVRTGHISITNTDPDVIKFTLFWLTKTLRVPKKKIRIALHLYQDMDIKREHLFWSKTINVSLSQFWKPYIKKTSTQAIDHSGFKHGTCRVYVGDIRLKERILMGIKAIVDQYKMGP